MEPQVQEVELKLLAQAIFERYGHDFRGYSEASLMRRVRAIMIKRNCDSITHLLGEVLHNPEVFSEVLIDLTVTTSEMFRDPGFYQAFREQIVPFLKTFSAFKIWHAGCSTGEEIYSMAILLEEEGIYDRAVVYATDINPLALQKAKEGIYPVSEVKQFTANYQAAGGRESFSSYYTAAYGAARFDPKLRRQVLFAAHNLVTDEVFSEVQVILCRNVLIYFDRSLQAHVIDLFTRSLSYKGYLCLGSKETVRFIDGGNRYEDQPGGQKIFRKIVRTTVGLQP